MSQGRFRSERGAAAVLVLVAVAVIAVMVIAAINVLAASRVRSARAGWDETLGSFDEIMARYPATEPNAGALELERIAAGLGIDLVTRSRHGRENLTGPARDAMVRLKDEVWGVYDMPHLQRVQRIEVGAPPPALQDYVKSFEAELAALRHHLLNGQTAVWESDLSMLQEAPIPNLLGHIDVAKLIVHAGLERLHAGDRETALDYARALQRHSLSLADSPILISQLILIAETRMLAGLLRQVDDIPAEWSDRLTAHDYRQSFIDAMKYEGWVWLSFGENTFFDSGPSWWRSLTKPAMRPYTQFCTAELSDAWRERIVNLERVDALCDHDLAEQHADLDIPVPRWNTIGRILVPNLTNAVDRVARLELDLELTLLIVEADALRREAGGAWSAPDDGHVSSRACPQDSWNYELTDGTLSIAFSRDIGWPNQKGAVLPNRIEMP